ncbi:MAG: hypothetical protein A2992_05305 [Elusimicrobia bacterium RIFCSPLOWO2_01_FULL_59_12]|nr:MAG: hypothetical protein A2992_05305 [Elusimicrobia bacterium RIFCSPLOWO2_01_FULL_59_12]
MSETSPHVADQLSGFIDNQLDETERSAVETHLQGCEECRHRYEELTQLRTTLQDAPVATPPESFYEGVLAQIEKPPARRFAFSFGLPAKALASACIVTLGFYIAREVRQPNTPKASMKFDQQKARLAEPQPAPVIQNSPPPQPAVVQPPAPPPIASQPSSQLKSEIAAKKTAPPAAVNDLSAESELRSTVDSLSKTQRKGAVERNDFLIVHPPVIARAPSASPAASGKATQGLSGKSARALADAKAKASVDVRSVAKESPFSSGELPEWRGTFSGIKTFRTVAIRTPQEWGRLWQDHTGSQPASTPPKVDFNTYMIVGVYAGEKPSGGYSMEILRTEETFPPALIVFYRENRPVSASQTAVSTQPFHLWVIPQSTLPVKYKKQ